MSKLQEYLKNRSLFFPSFISVLLAFLLFAVLMSLIKGIPLSIMLVSGGVMIIVSLLLWEPFSFLLFSVCILAVSIAIYSQIVSGEISTTLVTKIILYVFLATIAFIPLQIVFCGSFAVALDELKSGSGS